MSYSLNDVLFFPTGTSGNVKQNLSDVIVGSQLGAGTGYLANCLYQGVRIPGPTAVRADWTNRWLLPQVVVQISG